MYGIHKTVYKYKVYNNDDDDHIRNKCYYRVGHCEAQITTCTVSDPNSKLQARCYYYQVVFSLF